MLHFPTGANKEKRLNNLSTKINEAFDQKIKCSKVYHKIFKKPEFPDIISLQKLGL